MHADTRLVVNNASDKTLKRIQISSRDFETAHRFIEAAKLHNETATEYEALLLSAIVSYARPFSSNEKKRANTSVDARLPGTDIVAVLGEDAPLHDRVVTLRNEAVAHAESTHYPVEIISLPIGEPGTLGFAFSSRSWHVLNERIDLNAFSRIAQAMRLHCLRQAVDLARGAA